MKAVRIIGGFLILIVLFIWYNNSTDQMKSTGMSFGASEILIGLLAIGVAAWALYTGFQMKGKIEKD